MSLGFGVTITALGALWVFSALVLIVIACEIMKKLFKREAPIKEEIGEGISEKEKAAAIAAVTSYMEVSPASIAALKRGVQPSVWSITGRMELMERPTRREW